jgi:hypothetical protein
MIVGRTGERIAGLKGKWTGSNKISQMTFLLQISMGRKPKARMHSEEAYWGTAIVKESW